LRALIVASWLVCGFVALPCFALDPTKTVFQYDRRTWNYQNGLPVNGVDALAQTSDGYLWLGTSRGLVSFDGHEFKLIGMAPSPQLRSSFVQALAPAAAGGLWFGLRNSSYGFFDARSGWQSLPRPDGGMDWDIPALLETEGQTLWLGGTYASFRGLTNVALTELFAGSENAPFVSAIHQDVRGRVWLGTSEHGLYCWEKNQLTQITNLFADPRQILTLTTDRNGRLWIGTHTGLGWLNDERRWQPATFPNYAISALCVDQHGQLWIGTVGAGLARWAGENFSTLAKADGLAGDHVLALLEDREGCLWVGTRDGLTQLVDVKLPMLSNADGLVGQTVLSVSASPRGGLWICTDQGVNYFMGGERNFYSTEAGLQDKYVKRVWEASNGDVFVVTGKNQIEVMVAGRVVARHVTKAMPVALTEDSLGVVVSVAGELFRVSRDALTPYEFADGKAPSLYWVLNLMTSRDDAIWVASVNGVCRIKDGEYQHWTREDGLVDHHCRWLLEDEDGVIWAGMATGLSRLQGDKIQNIRREDGLMDGNIHALIDDRSGNFWIDSGRGIYRVSRRNLNAFVAGQINAIESFPFNGPEALRYSEKYGQEHSVCRTLDGRLWFPAGDGVVLVDSKRIAKNSVPPQVHLQRVRGNQEELNVTAPARVAAGNGTLEIEYLGLSFIAPQKIQYRYQLIGHDPDWVEAGNRRTAFYTNLKPGRYEFAVEAANADGVWSKSPARFVVELQPHYYQTAWFQSVLGTLVLSLGAGVVGWRVRRTKLRVRQMREVQELLEVKVRERTAELLRSNTFLTSEIEERKRMEAEVERIHRQLLDVSRQAGQAEVASSVLHNVGNVLNSVNVSTTLISDRLRRLRLENFERAVRLMQQNEGELGRFLTDDPKGRLLPDYLAKLATHLVTEQSDLLNEVKDLTENIDHIKGIVAMQQNYARVRGVTETVPLEELVESAIKMHAAAYARHGVVLIREFEATPTVTVDKHKVLQILVNILHNAKYACDESGRPDKQVTVRIQTPTPDRVRVIVADNGVGIAPENLRRLFSHGFTTRANGHGFGLHSAALAANELGGSLSAQSDGLGHGASFVLEFPLQQTSDLDHPAGARESLSKQFDDAVRRDSASEVISI
jgi:ligand-binding sensor domain-containing protein/signal transduction histidine kinase